MPQIYSKGHAHAHAHMHITGGQDGVVLFCEESPILDLQLDPTDDSIWAATTSTYVNKWPVDSGSMTNGEGLEGEEGMEVDEDEDVGITDIDDPQPLFTQPIASIPGQKNKLSCLLKLGSHYVL